MAERTIAHLVDEMQMLRKSTMLNTDIGIHQNNILLNIASNFDSYFDAQKAKAGKDREKEREDAAKPKVKPSAETPTFSGALKDAKEFGFLGIIGGIGAALTGLVVGALEGLRNSFRFLDEVFFRNLFTNKVIKPITMFFNALGDIFNKAGTGKILKGDTFKVFGKFTKTLADIATKYKRVITSVSSGSDKFFEFFGKISNFFKGIGRNIKAFFMSSSIIRSEIKNLSKLTSSFTNVTKAASEGGGFISRLGKVVKPFFGIFRKLGKFLGGPITVAIFSIIDSFIGAFKGFTETQGGLFAKISGAIMGAVAGLVSGFVGGLLDLGKMAVGFIAGLFGFDSFKEKLAEFSFQDMIFDAIMFPFRSIMKAVNAFKEGGLSGLGDFFTDSIKGIFDSIKAFVGDAFGGIGKKISAFFGMGDDSETPEPTPPSDSETPEPLEPGRSASRRRDRRRNARADFAPEEFSDRQQQIEDEKSRGSSPVVIQDNSNNSTNTSSSGGGGGYIAGVIQPLDPVDPIAAR